MLFLRWKGRRSGFTEPAASPGQTRPDTVQGHPPQPPGRPRGTARAVSHGVCRTANSLTPLEGRNGGSAANVLSARPPRKPPRIEVPAMLYVGIDWASDHHDLAALSPEGQQLLKARVPHSAEGFQ